MSRPSSATAPLRRVAITAVGIISPLGTGPDETFASLNSTRDCISPIRLFNPGPTRSQTAGQIDDDHLPPTVSGRHSRHQHRASRMLTIAAQQAFSADPGFRPESLVIGTTSGGMSYGEAFYRTLASETRASQQAGWLANYAPQKTVFDLLESLCLPPLPSQIIANACASGTNALGHAWKQIRHGLRDRVLAGGYDAISELVYVGFDSLQASTPDRCRPFCRQRSGLVLGEGAAVMALEEWESAHARRAPILGEIVGYGISTDNHHLTQPHPSGIGPLQAMQRALESAQLAPSEIGYINAHGTATPFNDATEGAAIEQLFGPDGVAVSSTKALMGHSLGAAGAIEAVISHLALKHQFLPPNANHQEADPQWQLQLITRPTAPTAPLHRAMSNSFGFGGTNASLILQSAAQS